MAASSVLAGSSGSWVRAEEDEQDESGAGYSPEMLWGFAAKVAVFVSELSVQREALRKGS